jgi:hypothetical protein
MNSELKMMALALLCLMGLASPRPGRAQALGVGDGAEVAAAMRAHRTSADTVVLNAVSAPASELRDNLIFQAALEIAGDAASSTEARVVAFRTLIQQLRPGVWIGYGQLASGGTCVGGVPTHGSATLLGAPLPSDAPAQVAARVAGVTASDPVALRNAATCASVYRTVADPLSDRDYEPVIVSRQVAIVYVCGNRFTVGNPFSFQVELVYEVVGTSEQGHLVVPSASAAGVPGEATVTTSAAGTVRLIEDLPGGEVIAIAANGGVPCS